VLICNPTLGIDEESFGNSPNAVVNGNLAALISPVQISNPEKETAKRPGIAITESGLAAEFLPASRRAPLPRIFGNPKCYDTKISSAYSSLPGICSGIEKRLPHVKNKTNVFFGLSRTTASWFLAVP
jgi:hypothetical protein